MYTAGDTIAAVATALGAGGIGIIRVSGPAASSILSGVTGRSSEAFRERYLEYGYAQEAGVILDEVLYVFMPGPRSFTGEDVAEIHAHGGSANLGRILRAVIAAGARHAEPGEFTRRAFENRRIDLTRAEAIADIVNASSEKALRVAQRQLRGELGTVIAGLSRQVTALLAEIEAGIDFPEEGLSEADRSRQCSSAIDAAQHCRRLGDSFGLGKILKDGVDVVLRGPVNAGKSSLFNGLIGRERALVAAEAGTTRDYVEAQVVWDGVLVTLVDTAGLRDAASDVEGQGIEFGAARAAEADIELLIRVAGSVPPESLDARQLLVFSKCDLVDSIPDIGIATSAETGAGVQCLKDAILKLARGGASESAEGCVVTNERQRARLLEAGQCLTRAAGLIEASAPAELAVVDLSASRRALAEITGEEVGDGLLDELFARFCIGK